MKQIRKTKISDQVCTYIREMIIQGKLSDGERIVESQIARELNISQAPVREALRTLEEMCFVENRPYVGSFVLSASVRRLEQAYAMRSVLECMAAEEAIHTATPEAIVRLEELLQEMWDDVKRDDRLSLIDHDSTFHLTIVKLADNPILEKMWHSACAPQWANLTVMSYDDLAYFPESHELLLTFLKNHNYMALQSELNKHFSYAASIAKLALKRNRKGDEADPPMQVVGQGK